MQISGQCCIICVTHNSVGLGFSSTNEVVMSVLANQKSYFRMLEDDASISGVPDAAYLKGTNNLFEMLFKVDTKPNRVVIYPSNLLHSGLIQQWRLVESSQGRLTANTFCIIERD
jgi:hypothetical protein